LLTTNNNGSHHVFLRLIDQLHYVGLDTIDRCAHHAIQHCVPTNSIAFDSTTQSSDINADVNTVDDEDELSINTYACMHSCTHDIVNTCMRFLIHILP